MSEKKRSRKKRTRDAVEILHNEFIDGDPEMEALLAEEETNLDVAEQIYRLRMEADLSQKELAARVGTTDTVISRLENADYEGHSLTMLRRIAKALNKRVEIRFVPLEGREAA